MEVKLGLITGPLSASLSLPKGDFHKPEPLGREEDGREASDDNPDIAGSAQMRR